MDLLKPLKQTLQKEFEMGCPKPGSNSGSELQVLKEVLWYLWGKVIPLPRSHDRLDNQIPHVQVFCPMIL